MKRDSEADRESAINLTSRPSSAPTASQSQEMETAEVGKVLYGLCLCSVVDNNQSHGVSDSFHVESFTSLLCSHILFCKSYIKFTSITHHGLASFKNFFTLFYKFTFIIWTTFTGTRARVILQKPFYSWRFD